LISLMISCIMSPIQASVFLWGWMNLKVGCDPFLFQHWGRYHSVSQAHTYQQPMAIQSHFHRPLHHQIHCHKCANR
jgi:hypothetical protein